ncbi:MAG: hypothetical protein ACR2OO_09095, partial [Thermomicrobiales bacterium]
MANGSSRTVAPSGRLAICDPIVWLPNWDDFDDPILHVGAGRFPVKVTQADVSGHEDWSHLRNAYATLLLSEAVEVVRAPFQVRRGQLVRSGNGHPDHYRVGVG